MPRRSLTIAILLGIAAAACAAAAIPLAFDRDDRRQSRPVEAARSATAAPEPQITHVEYHGRRYTTEEFDPIARRLARRGTKVILFQQYGAELDGYVMAFDSEEALTAYKQLHGYETADGKVIPRGDRVR